MVMTQERQKRQSVLEPRLDAATEGAFLRQLEDLEAIAQQVEYADLPLASGMIVPIQTENKPWATSVTYRQLDRTGFFRQIRSYATDIPTVTILSQEFTQKVYKFAGACYYTDDDIVATQHLGEDLSEEQITAVTEASEQTLNELIAFGRTPEGIESGFQGFINHPDALHSFSPYPLDSTASGDQILAVLNDSVTSVVKLTQQIEKPDTMLLDLDTYHYLISARLTNSVSDTTILQQFLKTNPYIKDIFPLNELTGTGTNQTTSMVVYKRDRSRLKVRIMQPLTWNNWERKGLGYERIAWFKYGGIVIYRPFSIHIVSGVRLS